MWVATVDFRKAFDSTSHQSLWKALEKCGIESNYISLLRRLYAEQKRLSQRTKKATCLRWRGERNKEILCPVYSSTRCSKWHWKTMWNAGKDQKAWVCDWATTNRIASQSCVLLTTCPCSLLRWCSSKKWCATSSRVLRVYDWKSTRTRRKFWATKVQTKEKKWRSTTLNKVEILSACESAKYLGQTITFQQQERAEVKNSNQSCFGIVLQIQTRADIKIVLPTTQTPFIQHDHADAELRIWHLDIIKGTRKNDTIDSTQNASPHRPIKEKIQKAKLSLAGTTKTKKRNMQTTEGQSSSSNTDCDQDSDISFTKDTNEEIDWHRRNWRRRLDWIHENRSC